MEKIVLKLLFPTVKSLDPKELESSPIFISDGITKGCHARVYVNKREEFKQVKAQLAILGSAVKKIGFGWIIVDNEDRSPLRSTLRNRDPKSFEKDASDPKYSQGTLTRHRIPSSYCGLSQKQAKPPSSLCSTDHFPHPPETKRIFA